MTRYDDYYPRERSSNVLTTLAAIALVAAALVTAWLFRGQIIAAVMQPPIAVQPAATAIVPPRPIAPIVAVPHPAAQPVLAPVTQPDSTAAPTPVGFGPGIAAAGDFGNQNAIQAQRSVISPQQQDQQALMLQNAADEAAAAQRQAYLDDTTQRPPDMSAAEVAEMAHRDPCHIPRADPATCASGLWKPTPINQ